MTRAAGSREQEAGNEPVVYSLTAEYGIVSEGAIQSYRGLRVWQGAVDLVEAVYPASRSFPADERFGLTSQIRRAAVSVPSNIAEGWARASKGEYVQFLRHAHGSLREAKTQWLLAQRLGYTGADATMDLERQSQTVGRQLIALMRALR